MGRLESTRKSLVLILNGSSRNGHNRSNPRGCLVLAMQNLTMDEFITEKVLGHQSQALPKVDYTSQWIIDKSQQITSKWLSYLKRNMAVCLELEYNPRSNNDGWESKLDSTRDMIFTHYWDCSTKIGGREFVIEAIQGLTSEEFAARLPLKVFRQHFKTGSECSMHSHAIVLPYGEHKPIPTVIAKNAWQLFRTYYPGWVYLFGNYPGRMLRSHWAQWKPYSSSASDSFQWFNVICSSPKSNNGGIRFDESHFDFDSTITKFDIEIRASDSSQELDQIISCRALTKALFLKSAELAAIGLIDLPKHRANLMNALSHDIYQGIRENGDTSLETRQGPTMQKIAVVFYREMRDYLTPFEKRNVRSCLMNPVRHRGVVRE